MASESSSSTPLTMDCTQVASALTLSWAEMRANSSPCFTGLLQHAGPQLAMQDSLSHAGKKLAMQQASLPDVRDETLVLY